MDIISAYREAGTYRGAAAISGTTPKTVRRVIARHEAGGGAPTVLNAANEVAVEEFLGRRLGFTGIAALVEATLEAAVGADLTREPESVDEAIAIDHNSRLLATRLLPEIAAKAF